MHRFQLLQVLSLVQPLQSDCVRYMLAAQDC
jgi:hypothetical protein